MPKIIDDKIAHLITIDEFCTPETNARTQVERLFYLIATIDETRSHRRAIRQIIQTILYHKTILLDKCTSTLLIQLDQTLTQLFQKEKVLFSQPILDRRSLRKRGEDNPTTHKVALYVVKHRNPIT